MPDQSEFLSVPVAQRRRAAAMVCVRTALVAAVIGVVYFVVPIGSLGNGAVGSLILLVAGLAVVVVALAFSVSRIVRSEHPGLRGAEAFGLVVPLFVFVFAAIYYRMAAGPTGVSGQAFTAPLTRIDALYFTVTVLVTVGFGDIVPTSQFARAVVTVQMVADLALLAVGVRLLLAAVRLRRGAGRADTAGAPAGPVAAGTGPEQTRETGTPAAPDQISGTDGDERTGDGA